MIRSFCTAFCLCLLQQMLLAQILFQENFENPGLPAGWTVQSLASDGGWAIGTAAALSSQDFNFASNGSLRFAGTNDDKCDCDKSQDLLISPAIDLSTTTAAVVKADVYFEGNSYLGNTEVGTIEVSLDKINWTPLDILHGHGSWDTHVYSLADYIGNSVVYIAFRYNDNSGWLYGMAIDNVIVEEPISLDASMIALQYRPFGEENVAIPISGTIFNNGATAITELEMNYSLNGTTPVSGTLSNLNIAPFTYYEFEHPKTWIPGASGVFEVEVSITAVNGVADQNPDNNKQNFEIEIFQKIIPPNRIDEFLAVPPVFETIATSADKLDKPTDLDFFPILAKNEVWVINERIENSGGSTVTVNNAGMPDQSTLQRVDGNAWHFMSLPTALAFSNDNFNWASSTGVKDANHNGGTFTGPTLWSSDPAIYAQPSGGNGSHLDMLHGSPYSMGIAHEKDNAFWVFDGWNSTIVRYDFQKDHGPGNDDHSDGLLRRYVEIQVKRDPGGVPSHLVLDKSTGWLYVVDNGNNRVLRLDINSGQVTDDLPLINEPLEEHSAMGGVSWEVIINQGLSRPCGIELIENRLLVGNYTTGEIVVYDIANSFAELGRIATGQAGLTGLKIGPDGALWYTNRLQNTLTKVSPGVVSATGAPALAEQVQVLPNPTNGRLLVRLPETFSATLVLSNLAGQQIKTVHNAQDAQYLDLSNLPNGMYNLTVFGESFSTTRKVVLNK